LIFVFEGMTLKLFIVTMNMFYFYQRFIVSSNICSGNMEVPKERITPYVTV